MTPTTMTWGAYWYAALNAKWGIFIRCTDSKQLKSILYVARRNLADPALMDLTINTSPTDPRGTLWLVKSPPRQSNGVG